MFAQDVVVVALGEGAGDALPGGVFARRLIALAVCLYTEARLASANLRLVWATG